MRWLFLIIIFIFLPEPSYAWGPLTHTYLSGQILSLSGLVTAEVLTIIKLYKDYFIYGNIIPDTVIGKKYLPQEKNPHSWKTGFMLLNRAKTPEEKSFAYGFLTHLAADAVLHDEIRELNSFQHIIFEIKADRIVDRFYWLQIMSINKRVKKISERFFEQTLVNPVSMKTSKKIYKSLIFLSAFNTGELKNPEAFDIFHLKSLTAMVEILNHGENSKIISLPPYN
ncbi:zinc dependent phospholipase C family protein [Thermodesulfovibrio sp. 3907-1M]|uniref:Zinc dependent phospholipase C family protein n=1 Tax=Thermodesulfovibrio autotrophicus TaxID=3118333 RepID=A0AAU8GUG7_9BACT